MCGIGCLLLKRVSFRQIEVRHRLQNAQLPSSLNSFVAFGPCSTSRCTGRVTFICVRYYSIIFFKICVRTSQVVGWRHLELLDLFDCRYIDDVNNLDACLSFKNFHNFVSLAECVECDHRQCAVAVGAATSSQQDVRSWCGVIVCDQAQFAFQKFN